jgi:sec-independent protein translocase protein TatA
MELFGILSAPAPTELIVLLVIAVLLFGQNLPQVARTWGAKLAEFRRGMKSIQDEIRSITSDVSLPESSRPAIADTRKDDPDDREEPTAPKFEPPPG